MWPHGGHTRGSSRLEEELFDADDVAVVLEPRLDVGGPLEHADEAETDERPLRRVGELMRLRAWEQARRASRLRA
eukprot:1002755-Prymnesium_polylepis.2